MSEITQDVCLDLIVYTDFGHGPNTDHKRIATSRCKAEEENRACTRRGVCIEARENRTWKRVNFKTFMHQHYEEK
jgi:hypothetical protein